MSKVSMKPPNTRCARAAAVLGLLLALSACGLAARVPSQRELAGSDQFSHTAGYAGLMD